MFWLFLSAIKGEPGSVVLPTHPPAPPAGELCKHTDRVNRTVHSVAPSCYLLLNMAAMKKTLIAVIVAAVAAYIGHRILCLK